MSGPALQRARTLFTPAIEAARFASVEPEPRAAATRALDVAVSHRRSAESLWTTGHPLQAHLLLRRSVDATREALSALGESEALERLDAVEGEPDDELGFAARRDVLRRLHGEFRSIAWTSRELPRITRARRSILVAALLGAALVFLQARRTLRAPRVAASAAFSKNHAATAAIDGDLRTEWLLPDRSNGQLDVIVTPARKVNRLRLVNARNEPFDDRGTKDFIVEASLEGGQVSSQSGSFSAPNDVRDIPIGAKIDRLQIKITSHLGSGAGLAEVIVE
jgi:hypothetical protein